MDKRSEINKKGWSQYARDWSGSKHNGTIPGLPGQKYTDIQYIGDEWSHMDGTDGGYGLNLENTTNFLGYLDKTLLDPCLSHNQYQTILELGGGGGRITSLLMKYATKIYEVDISEDMLAELKKRFAGETRISYHLSDGTIIQGIPENSLDLFFTFDAFVHCEPYEIFHYLRLVYPLLKTNALGIVHFSDAETPLGFATFERQVYSKLKEGTQYYSFSTMCKSLMETFLKQLGYEILTISNEIIPRDAIAVFRKK